MNPSALSLYDELLAKVDLARLSELLLLTIRLAKDLGENDLRKWASLELNGYFADNPAQDPNASIPEYRKVVGTYLDEYRRPLRLEDPEFQYILQQQLGDGVVQLEEWAGYPPTRRLTIDNVTAISFVRAHFSPPASYFTFSPVEVRGVLASIRTQLLERLCELRPTIDQVRASVVPTHVGAVLPTTVTPNTRRVTALTMVRLVVAGLLLLAGLHELMVFQYLGQWHWLAQQSNLTGLRICAGAVLIGLCMSVALPRIWKEGLLTGIAGGLLGGGITTLAQIVK